MFLKATDGRQICSYEAKFPTTVRVMNDARQLLQFHQSAITLHTDNAFQINANVQDPLHMAIIISLMITYFSMSFKTRCALCTMM